MDPHVIAKAAKAGNFIESIVAAVKPGRDGPTEKSVRIIAFRSIGDANTLTVRGRVVRMAPTRARALDATGAIPAREHLVAVYRAFDVLEVPNVSVVASCEAATASGMTDDGGFFSIDIPASSGATWTGGWHHALVSLESNANGTADTTRVSVEVFVPAAVSTLAIVSDLDDTAMDSYTTRTWRMLQTVMLRSAHRRQAVPGVPSLYRALHRGAAGNQANPICYISSGAWNLYDMVTDYLDVHEMPRGAVFLNDWGSRQRAFHTVAYEHKGAHMGVLFARYPTLPFLLIGDDVHEDPELYAMLAERFPGRVPAIWIRLVRDRAKRNAEMRELGEKLRNFGTELTLSSSSENFVVDAKRRSWI